VNNDRVILCGGVAAPASARGKPALALDLQPPNGNVMLKLLDISGRMTANMAPVLVDLLEIATYVYCADQAATRGGPTSQDFGAAWRRRFEFHIPVREPDLWSSKPVRSALCDTLGFLSDDDYDFNFKKLRRQQPATGYLDFAQDTEAGFQAEEVILFSGGLDSLGGAVHEVVDSKRSVALVSHRSSAKIDAKQQQLVRDLSARSLRKPLHIPVWVNKEKALGREYTQRSRSFLFAAMGAVVARLFDLWRLRFYENGVVGGRATRTTHPQVLNGFAEIFSAVFEKPFAVENPFRWKTKAEVVEVIRAGGCGDLVRHAVSCTHVWDMTTLHTHCGTCSQCIDRRFATLAAGCTDKEDPPEMYVVDLLRGERPPGNSRTMLESYVSTTKRVRTMTDSAFFGAFGEAHRVIRHVRGMSADGAAAEMLNLYRRHAAAVFKVITNSIAAHATEIASGTVPSSCLLILALPEEYKRPASFVEDTVDPVLVLDDIKDGGVTRALLARIVGHEHFDGLNKKIGVRELFFVFLLFGSTTRTHNFAGQVITVVSEDEVSQELLKWSDAQHLEFTGPDRDRPAHRVAKMWREFVKQIGKERKLNSLFTNEHRSAAGERLFALRLRPAETQILVASVPALFKSQAASH
jgi:hypothetical protein